MRNPNRKTQKFIVSSILSLLVCGCILISTPQKAFAYEKETHFWFTYYLAIKAGYTRVQAMQVASADVAVDFDEDTVPEFASIEYFKNFLNPQDFFQEVRIRFHALPHKSTVMRKSGAKENEIYFWDPQPVEGDVLKVSDKMAAERRDEFWAETLAKPVNPGPFLHYMQDMYPHRGFLSYVGHPGYYYADFIATDLEKAERMTFESLRYLIAFREVYFEKKPAAEYLDVQSIDVNSYLSEETVADIRETLNKFAKANPSPGREKNVLTETWLGLEESQRNTSYLIPPSGFFSAIREVGKNYRSTDSSKSRKVVKEVFGYERSQMPDIWIYDLTNRTKKGVFQKKKTSRVMIYLEVPGKGNGTSPNGIGTADEAANTRMGTRRDDNRRKLCLPAALVDESVERVPPC